MYVFNSWYLLYIYMLGTVTSFLIHLIFIKSCELCVTVFSWKRMKHREIKMPEVKALLPKFDPVLSAEECTFLITAEVPHIYQFYPLFTCTVCYRYPSWLFVCCLCTLEGFCFSGTVIYINIISYCFCLYKALNSYTTRGLILIPFWCSYGFFFIHHISCIGIYFGLWNDLWIYFIQSLASSISTMYLVLYLFLPILQATYDQIN